MSGEESSRAALYREWVSAVFTGWLSETARRSRRLRDWKIADRREIIANARGRLLAEAADLLSAPSPIYASPLLQALDTVERRLAYAVDRVAQLVPVDRVQLALDVERQNYRNRGDSFGKLKRKLRIEAAVIDAVYEDPRTLIAVDAADEETDTAYERAEETSAVLVTGIRSRRKRKPVKCTGPRVTDEVMEQYLRNRLDPLSRKQVRTNPRDLLDIVTARNKRLGIAARKQP